MPDNPRLSIRLFQAFGRWDRRFARRRPKLAGALMLAPAAVLAVAVGGHGEAARVAWLIFAPFAFVGVAAFVTFIFFVVKRPRSSQPEIDRYLERRAAQR